MFPYSYQKTDIMLVEMHGTGFYQSISKLNLVSEEEPAAFAKVCGVHGIKHLEDIECYWRHLVSSKQDIHEQN